MAGIEPAVSVTGGIAPIQLRMVAFAVVMRINGCAGDYVFMARFSDAAQTIDSLARK